MKLQFLILFGLIGASMAGGFGIDIDNLLWSKPLGLISHDDLKYIVQSQYNQYHIVMAFFKAGDLSKDLNLVLAEFARAYGSFIYWLIGKQIPVEFIYARFELADYANQNNAIDLSEFTFLVITDLRLIYDNYCLFDEGLQILQSTIVTIEKFFEDHSNTIQTDWLFQGAFFGFDYDKNNEITPPEFRSGIRILGYIIGVNLSFVSPVLNDFFSIADTNGDGQLNSAEAYAFVSSLVGQAKLLFAAIASA